MKMFVRALTIATCCLGLLLELPLVAQGTRNADGSVTYRAADGTSLTYVRDGSVWAEGGMTTYLGDRGAVDSRVRFWAHYVPDSRNRIATIDSIVAMETPPKSGNTKLWIQYCYGNSCAGTYQMLRTDTWQAVRPNWRVRLGSQIKVKVTNSWDPTGVWGETWTGVVTLR